MRSPLKILLAPDKFKGSLSAKAASEAIARGWSRALPNSQFLHAPMADGGEGFCEALHAALEGEWITLPAVDALGRPIDARYLWVAHTRTAVIEMSEASGLWRISPQERNPLKANTFGTGLLMRDAILRGAARILVGLGGSATTDGGIGMAAALGYRFLGADGAALDPVPQNLPLIRKIESSEVPPLPEVVAACDVQNPLLGERGTATVFAPQKGADADAIRFLENGLTHLADKVRDAMGCDFRDTPGAGAAGGIGFGLLSFCTARMEPGFELVSAAVDLPGLIAAADLVVTGEGRIDSQTLEGKGPVGIAALSRKAGKPVIAFAGSIEDSPLVQERFDACIPIVDRPVLLEEAMRSGSDFLERAAERTARLFAIPPPAPSSL